MNIRLSAPTQAIFLISVVLAVLALIGLLARVPLLTGNSLILLAIAYAVLLFGNLYRGA